MTADRYPEGFDLEKNLRVFRTHKGNIEQGIRGSIFVRNPNPSAKIEDERGAPLHGPGVRRRQAVHPAETEGPGQTE